YQRVAEFQSHSRIRFFRQSPGTQQAVAIAAGMSQPVVDRKPSVAALRQFLSQKLVNSGLLLRALQVPEEVRMNVSIVGKIGDRGRVTPNDLRMRRGEFVALRADLFVGQQMQRRVVQQTVDAPGRHSELANDDRATACEQRVVLEQLQ